MVKAVVEGVEFDEDEECMVDHDSGVLLWAHPGPDQKTLEKFFDRLGAEPVALTLVSADAVE